MSSATGFNLDQSKIVLSCNAIARKLTQQMGHNFICRQQSILFESWEGLLYHKPTNFKQKKKRHWREKKQTWRRQSGVLIVSDASPCTDLISVWFQIRFFKSKA